MSSMKDGTKYLILGVIIFFVGAFGVIKLLNFAMTEWAEAFVGNKPPRCYCEIESNIPDDSLLAHIDRNFSCRDSLKFPEDLEYNRRSRASPSGLYLCLNSNPVEFYFVEISHGNICVLDIYEDKDLNCIECVDSWFWDGRPPQHQLDIKRLRLEREIIDSYKGPMYLYDAWEKDPVRRDSIGYRN